LEDLGLWAAEHEGKTVAQREAQENHNRNVSGMFDELFGQTRKLLLELTRYGAGNEQILEKLVHLKDRASKTREKVTALEKEKDLLIHRVKTLEDNAQTLEDQKKDENSRTFQVRLALLAGALGLIASLVMMGVSFFTK